jgi:RNA chaperone Hfq
MSEKFLVDLKGKENINIYLVNGIKLSGEYISHDDIGVVLSAGPSGGEQLVMRSAISTVVPHAVSDKSNRRT